MSMLIYGLLIPDGTLDKEPRLAPAQRHRVTLRKRSKFAGWVGSYRESVDASSSNEPASWKKTRNSATLPSRRIESSVSMIRSPVAI